jgi:hypothetical protein
VDTVHARINVDLNVVHVADLVLVAVAVVDQLAQDIVVVVALLLVVEDVLMDQVVSKQVVI